MLLGELPLYLVLQAKQSFSREQIETGWGPWPKYFVVMWSWHHSKQNRRFREGPRKGDCMSEKHTRCFKKMEEWV